MRVMRPEAWLAQAKPSLLQSTNPCAAEPPARPSMKFGRQAACVPAIAAAFTAFSLPAAYASERHDSFRHRHAPAGHAAARHTNQWPGSSTRGMGASRHVPAFAVHGPGSRAYHSGPSFRVWVGPSFYAGPGPYWPSPYYHPPAVVYRYPPAIISLPPAAPPVYVERQGETGSDATQSASWYWCQSGNAYYPQVPECPEGWIAVAPQRAPAN